jgi:hypothetical protein
LLYAAELYAIATLLLAYFQTLKVRDRQSMSLAPDADPAVALGGYVHPHLQRDM